MTAAHDRHVLVLGPALETLARDTFGDAVEVAGPDRILGNRGPAGMADVILIDADSEDPHLLVSVIEQLAREDHPPVTILSGVAPTTAVVRALLRLPKSDILEPPWSSADLAVAAGRLLSPHPGSVTGRNRCFAVMSAVGGGGATTLTIELASAMARLGNGRTRVGIVDLNLADGAASAYLGVTPNMHIASAAFSAERIDASLLEIFAAKPNDHLDLLASPRDPKAFERASAQSVLKLLDVACQTYDCLVIDMPRHRHPWTIPALSGCDEVVIISELTVPALLAARAMAEEYEADLPDGPRPRVVLNRLASRMFGPAPSLAEAEKALGRKADGGICSDWEAAAASVNLGGPICQHRPKSKICRDVDALARMLMAAPPRQSEKAA